MSTSPPGSPRPERPPRVGWDSREPGILALALLVLLIAGLLPWWGFTVDTSRIPYRTSEGTDFGPWFDEEWQFQLLPGTVRRTGVSWVWWDFVAVRPQYATYATSALLVSSLWTLAVLTMVTSLVFRVKPRSRLRGWPTVFEAIAAAAVGSAVVVAALGFPLGTDFSFVGEASDTTWGPKLGWYLALVVAALASTSTSLGRTADRTLRGKCWKCYRPVTEPVCAYCSTPQ